jgi:rubrerythrin
MMNRLAYAIQMEVDGEQYYLKQARLNRDNPLFTVFTILAKTEEKHVALLRSIANGPLPADIGANAEQEKATLFSSLDDFKSGSFRIPEQLEAYQVALEMEQKSVALYESLLLQPESQDEQRLLTYLVQQEKDHVTLMENLMMLLERPKDWVESAEFGKREDY